MRQVKTPREVKKPILIYAINGSSRRSGRTSNKLGIVVKDLRKESGVQVEILNLVSIPLRFSSGEEDPRVQHGDIRRLLNRLDGVIFATPTYWFNMSARMKNLLDRLSGVAETGREWPLENRVAAFLAVGHPREDGAMVAIMTMAAAVNNLGMVISPFGMLYFRGDDNRAAKKQETAYFSEYFLNTIRAIRDGIAVR